jgi:SAM-dependent methyltransferase/uncharacterized protein YbaR (Trm112 family)
MKLVCPNCKQNLIELACDEPELKKEPDLFCANCNTRYYIVNGVPILTHIDNLGWVGLDAAYRLYTRDQLSIPFDQFFNLINKYSSPTIKDLETLLRLSFSERCVESQHINYINERNPYYNELYKKTCKPIYEWVTDVVERYACGNSDILDIGIGGGQMEHYLSAAFPNTTTWGIDIDFSLCTRCYYQLETGNFPNVRVLCADVKTMPIASNSVDCVVSSGGLSHIEGLNKALKEIYRVLKPGGVVICAEFETPITSPCVQPFLTSIDRSNGFKDIKNRLIELDFSLVDERLNIGADSLNPQHGAIFQKAFSF